MCVDEIVRKKFVRSTVVWLGLYTGCLDASPRSRELKINYFSSRSFQTEYCLYNSNTDPTIVILLSTSVEHDNHITLNHSDILTIFLFIFPHNMLMMPFMFRILFS